VGRPASQPWCVPYQVSLELGQGTEEVEGQLAPGVEVSMLRHVKDQSVHIGAATKVVG
jgi:hypothetical protein